MFKLALLAGALAIAFSFPVSAQGCQTLPEVQAILDGNEMTHTMVPEKDMADFIENTVKPALFGTVPEGVTAVLVAILGDAMVFGLEIDGCMSPPIAFANAGPRA
jgi:hypothetical protein